MAKPSKSGNLSKKVLLGVVVTTLPLVGCDVIAPSGEARTSTTNEVNITATEEDRALFERARELGTAAAAEEFLQTSTNRDLTRRLLHELPTATLQRIDDEIVDQLDPAVVNTLPFYVKQALGVRSQVYESDGGSSPSDGYSG